MCNYSQERYYIILDHLWKYFKFFVGVELQPARVVAKNDKVYLIATYKILILLFYIIIHYTFIFSIHDLQFYQNLIIYIIDAKNTLHKKLFIVLMYLLWSVYVFFSFINILSYFNVYFPFRCYAGVLQTKVYFILLL